MFVSLECVKILFKDNCLLNDAITRVFPEYFLSSFYIPKRHRVMAYAKVDKYSGSFDVCLVHLNELRDVPFEIVHDRRVF